MTKVAIYTRVSSEEQVKGYGLEVQEEKLREYCKLYNLELKERYVFKEEGVSGAERSRPALGKLLECAKRREIDLVLVYKIDRLSRLLKDLLSLVNELQESGAGFRSITESFDTSSPSGRCMFQMLGSFAELEREVIRERMVGGQIKAKKDGKWAGQAPYGYNLNKATAKLEINNEEARIVKKLFKWLVEERMTLHGIQRKLNELKIPTKFDNLGKKKKVNGEGFWRTRTIGRILTNEVYTGQFIYSKYKNVDKHKRDKIDNLRPEEEWIVIKTPKIINQEVLNLAKEQIYKNRVHSDRNKKRNYLFTGLIECGVCGGKYASSYDAYRKHTLEEHRKRYFCNNSRKYVRQDICKTPSVTESRIEEPIWKRIVEVLSNPKLAFEQLDKIQNKKKDEEGFEEKIKELEVLISKKKDGIAKLLDLYLNGSIEKTIYEEKARKLKDDLVVYINELEKYKNQVISEKEKGLRVNSIEGMYKQFKSNLENIGYAEKREVLKMLVNKAVIKGNNIDIHCNIPYKYAFMGQSTHFWRLFL